MSDQARSTAATIGAAFANGTVRRLLKGEVTGIGTPGVVDVELEQTGVSFPFEYLGAKPAMGDAVYVVEFGTSRYLVLGKVGTT